jgi:hypothetical protein
MKQSQKRLTGRVAHPLRFFPSRFETGGAPLLRFVQGRVRC